MTYHVHLQLVSADPVMLVGANTKCTSEASDPVMLMGQTPSGQVKLHKQRC